MSNEDSEIESFERRILRNILFQKQPGHSQRAFILFIGERTHIAFNCSGFRKFVKITSRVSIRNRDVKVYIILFF